MLQKINTYVTFSQPMMEQLSGVLLEMYKNVSNNPGGPPRTFQMSCNNFFGQCLNVKKILPRIQTPPTNTQYCSDKMGILSTAARQS